MYQELVNEGLENAECRVTQLVIVSTIMEDGLEVVSRLAFTNDCGSKYRFAL